MRNSRLQSATLLVGAAMAVLSSTPLSAALLIQVEPVSTISAPGTNGYLQVVLTNTGPDVLTLASFAIDVAVDGLGVVLTGVDSNTDEPYIFGDIGSGSLTFDFFTNDGFNLNDFVFDLVNDPPQSEITVSAGQSYGLGRIAFLVDDSAANGIRNVTLSNPVFGDSTAMPLDLDVIATGTAIDVRGEFSAPVLPEPGTLSMFLAGSVLLAGSAWRQRANQVAH